MNSSHNGKGAISIRSVSKIYDPEGVNVEALRDCSLEIKAQEFVSIVGPSGCGKTTLLNAVVLFQGGALFPWKTVLENIVYGPVVQGRLSRSMWEEKAIKMLEQVGLTGIEKKYPEELSSGVQRRVEILRALINEPKVVLLDEPFRALDAVAKTVMHEFLAQIFCSSPRTMFFITHDLDEAIFLSHRVVVMTTRPGQIKKIVEIELPWPRKHQIRKSKEFLSLKAEVMEAVHEEAKKAFESGEREMA